MDTKYGENSFGSESDSDVENNLDNNMKMTLVSILSIMKQDVKTLTRYKKRIDEQETIDSIDSIKENICKLHKKFLEEVREVF